VIELADGTNIWTRTVGDGSAPVLVPGAVVDQDLEMLAGADRPAFFYDVRNRGRSDAVDDPEAMGFRQEVRDIDEVRQALGLERMALVGSSYLGAVTARYALDNPGRVTRLVLISAPGPMTESSVNSVPAPAPDALAALDQLQASGADVSDPERYCAEWRRVFLSAQMGDPEALQRSRGEPCRYKNEWPENVTKAVAHVFLDLGFYDWRHELAQLNVPCLVVHGSADSVPREAAEAWVVAMPEARLLSMEGVGRYPWLEAPERFFDEVGEFLDGAWPKAARR
jgi:pimeloyl-ACP methyl ester carboxylesterase